jgi:hypothetical protein
VVHGAHVIGLPKPNGPREIDANCATCVANATGANLAGTFEYADAGTKDEGQTVGL